MTELGEELRALRPTLLSRRAGRGYQLEHRLAEALERTSLPPEPDRTAVDRFLVDAYRRGWAW